MKYGYLLLIYLVLVILSSLKVLPTSMILYGLAAVIVAFLFIRKSKEKKIKINKYWLILAFLLILIPRVIPYIDNTIPIGYDAGIYKYGIENKIDQDWEKATFEPLFNILIKFLNLIFPSTFILTFFLILFELLIGLSIYLTVKEYFDENTAILAVLLFALSFVQFRAFTLLYYKNIIALSLLLLTFYFLKKEDYLKLIITGILLAGIHRPTFLIFGLSFLAYTIVKRKKEYFLSGFTIVLFSLALYLDRLKEALIPGIEGITSLNIGGGTFLTLTEYKPLILIYIPFLAIGLYSMIKENKGGILMYAFLLNFVTVVFSLIFFNRYIISLDLIILIFVAYGLMKVLQDNRVVGIATIVIITLFLGYGVFTEALQINPLIDHEELEEISSLQNVEENALVMATTSYYSPWVLGYSGRETIAPGLFKVNKWNKSKWEEFWGADYDRAVEMLKEYDRPLYIHVGKVNRFDTKKFEGECFEPVIKERVWRVEC